MDIIDVIDLVDVVDIVDVRLLLRFSHKRSVLAGLVKFLAVGCGLNEASPSANISVV